MTWLYHIYDVINDSDNIPQLDLYIAAAGVEERSYSVFNHYGPKCKKMLLDIEKNRPNESSNQSLIDSYEKYKIYFEKDDIYKSNSDKELITVINTNIHDEKIIGLDITNIKIPDIYIVLNCLKKKNIDKLFVFYAEPKQYVIDNFTEQIKKTNVMYDPQEVKGYSTQDDHKKSTLVLIIGFDQQVADYVQDKIQSDDLIVINGFPSFVPKFKDISLRNNYSLLTKDFPQSNLYYSRADNPFSTYQLLCEYLEKHDEAIKICAIGPKPMALGACLFSLNNRSRVSLIYPYPDHYINNTSTNYSKILCYEIPLNNLENKLL